MKKKLEHYKLIIERVGKDMNKKEYISEIKEELAGLKKNSFDYEINKLERKIERLEKKNYSWAEIKKKLGNSKECAKKIFEKYDNDPIEWLSLVVARFIRLLTDWIQEFANMIANPKLKDLVHALVVIFLILIILVFLKYPFLILLELLQYVLSTLHISIPKIIQFGISSVLYLCYFTSMFIIAIWMIEKYIMQYFQTKQQLSFETKANQKWIKKLSQNMSTPFLIIYKIIGFVFLIPFLILTLFFLITTIVSIALIINNTGYIFSIVLSIGLTIFFTSILLFLTTFVFQKKHRTWQKLKYCFLGFIVIMVGLAIMPIEYLGYTNMNHNVLLEEDSTTKNYTFDSTDIQQIKILNNGQSNHINYVVDNTTNQIVVEVIYPSKYYDLSNISYTKQNEMIMDYRTNIKEGKEYELFSKLFYFYVTKTEQKLKYSYFTTELPDITVRANEENMHKINKDNA